MNKTIAACTLKQESNAIYGCYFFENERESENKNPRNFSALFKVHEFVDTWIDQNKNAENEIERVKCDGVQIPLVDFIAYFHH